MKVKAGTREAVEGSGGNGRHEEASWRQCCGWKRKSRKEKWRQTLGS